MADTSVAQPAETAAQQPPVVVKKYANRRLYNTETSSYITLDNLADMIRAGRDFVVYDAKSGEDITRGVLTQIIVEEESKGSAMLPTAFLRQLIGFYGDSLQGVVPRYLEQAMANFAVQQKQMRQVVQQTFGPFMPMGVEEMSRQNVALMERAMTMFNPFHRPGDSAPRPAGSSDPAPQPAEAGHGDKATLAGQSDKAALTGHGDKAALTGHDDMAALRHEVENLRAQLAIARAEAVVRHAPSIAASAPNVVAESAPNVVADPPGPAPVQKPKPARKQS